MQTFDQSLWDLFQAGLINYETALENASNADDFKLRMQGIAFDCRHLPAGDAVGRLRRPITSELLGAVLLNWARVKRALFRGR